MNADKWRIAVMQCHGFKDMMGMLGIYELLNAGRTAQAVGFVLDPTLYRNKAAALDCDIKILEAATTYMKTVEDVLATARKKS